MTLTFCVVTILRNVSKTELIPFISRIKKQLDFDVKLKDFTQLNLQSILVLRLMKPYLK